MPNHEPETQLSDSESRLARELIASARLDDSTPRATDAAWARFSSAFSAAALGASAASPVDRAGGAGAAPRATTASSSAAQWLLIGVVTGSAITAAWLTSRPHSEASLPSAMSLSANVPPLAPQPASSAPLPLHAPTTALPRAPEAERRSPRAAEQALVSPTTRAPAHGEHARSTLAAEVAQLDAARTALEVGAFDEALRLLAKFHREFPNGELAAEAEVMRIEVLSARKDQAGARREAERFLERHANDPHAERVRQLGSD